jgi:hypothetical protein
VALPWYAHPWTKLPPLAATLRAKMHLMNVQKTKPIRIDKRTVIVPIGKKYALKNVRWNQLHHGHGERTTLLDSEE